MFFLKSLRIIIEMKFNHIIGNPPFGRLYLKIIRETLKYSDDHVVLSPIRWLQDPLAEYKRGSDWKKFGDIRRHISSLDIIDKVTAQKLFDIGNLTDLGIYHLTPKGGWKQNVNPIVEKIVAHSEDTFRGKLNDKNHDGYGVVLYTFVGGSGRHFDGTFTGEILHNGLRDDGTDYKIRTNQCKGWNDFRIYNTINFDTRDEAENFKLYCESTLMKWFAVTCIMNNNATNYYNYFPFMPTYTHPWKDEDLFEYFGLTKEEVEIIENAIQ